MAVYGRRRLRLSGLCRSYAGQAPLALRQASATAHDTGVARTCQASARTMRGRRCLSGCWGLGLGGFAPPGAALHASKNTLRASAATCMDAPMSDLCRFPRVKRIHLCLGKAWAPSTTASLPFLAAPGRLHATLDTSVFAQSGSLQHGAETTRSSAASRLLHAMQCFQRRQRLLAFPHAPPTG